MRIRDWSSDVCSSDLGDARATQKMAFERSLARSIEDLIVPIAGPGRARAQVTADLDFDKRQTTSETFAAPDQAPVVNEVTSDATYTGAGGAVGGVIGPGATPHHGAPEHGREWGRDGGVT